MRFSEGPVKYFDFKGEAAVDNNDNHNLISELRSRGVATQTERLAGFRILINENSSTSISEIGVLAYLYSEQDCNGSEVKRVRAVDTTFKPSEVFGLFKRFDLLLSDPDLKTEGVEVEGPFCD
ncbi:MAG: hypothetical protein ACSHWZ_09185 [Sulfitobacter sp.]